MLNPMAPIAPISLLPGILILNAKYLPDSETSAAKVGATSIAFSVAHVLQHEGLFAGMILYQRQEDLSQPKVSIQFRASIPCVVLCFNFEMRRSDIRDAISSATEMLLMATRGVAGLAILYHQTDTLLAYSPCWLPSCVTHHGPFYDDFVQHFCMEQAAIAFGSREKAYHLRKHQRIGLNHLRRSKNTFVLQHSSVQRKYLTEHGIDPAQIYRLSPPIDIGQFEHQDLAATHPEIASFVEKKPSLILFTAVARLDFFKNVELLMDAGIELLRRGIAVKVLVAGGDDSEQFRRANLLERVPTAFISAFMVAPKLPKDSLYALFDAVKDNGFFVCPSRYETLGITPLEAALSAVPTLIVDNPNVEASCYFPPGNRFRHSATDLAKVVEHLQKEGMQGRGEALRNVLKKHISHENFKQSLLKAWAVFSKPEIGSLESMLNLSGEVVQSRLVISVEIDGTRLGHGYKVPGN
ncbi:uncharacterized protein L3040_001379 [Drepanopeziza brunnea f. sp. 'multigermtubi']|uniref:uncharacterized protein n=1 Tax=Drepanopeziza brunnea f. sp. 'multigermtubi' TaxID=698441 RepID=UPI00238877F9|nr:hypothetical protein L3040_001379 [Drepanopeziza brunnea f. sp. 'multigermtubi']